MVPMYDATKLKPTSLLLLDLLAFLGTALPEEILQPLAIGLLSAELPFDEAAYEEARQELLDEPLIVQEGARKKLVILDTVQDQVFRTVDAAKRTKLFEGVMRRIWLEWPAGLPKPSKEPELPEPKMRSQRLLINRWSACDEMLPTIVRLELIYPNVTNISDDDALLFAKLMTEGAWYQIERGYRSKVLCTLITALDITSKSDHPDKNATLADIRFCLGVLAMESNDFDVSRKRKEDSFNLVAEICDDLGVEDERLALAYSERGISRIQDRRYKEGIADIETSIRIMKDLDSKYVPHSREANIAWALMGQGKLNECDELLAESLALREGALGRDHAESPRTGLILNAIAALRAAQGDLDESHTYHQRAWIHLRSTVGVQDPCTGRVAHKLAEHLLRVQRADEALVVINQALDAWSVDSFANQNEEARSMYVKSQALAALGKSEAAGHVRKRAVDSYNAITRQKCDMNAVSLADFDVLMPFWSR